MTNPRPRRNNSRNGNKMPKASRPSPPSPSIDSEEERFREEMKEARKSAEMTAELISTSMDGGGAIVSLDYRALTKNLKKRHDRQKKTRDRSSASSHRGGVSFINPEDEMMRIREQRRVVCDDSVGGAGTFPTSVSVSEGSSEAAGRRMVGDYDVVSSTAGEKRKIGGMRILRSPRKPPLTSHKQDKKKSKRNKSVTNGTSATSKGSAAGMRRRSSQEVKDKWMCSLCGLVLSSRYVAEMHEYGCVRDACRKDLFFAYSEETVRRRVRPNEDLVGPILSHHESVMENDTVPVSDIVRQRMTMTDENLRQVVNLSSPYVITPPEKYSERELGLLARDLQHCNLLTERQADRTAGSTKSKGTGFLASARNRFTEAYDLIKEGDSKSQSRDHYGAANQLRHGRSNDIRHDQNTVYLNVVLHNSARVVNNELKRLGRSRWADLDATAAEKNQFQRFRNAAQLQIIKLASFALAQDFTPRRVARQLSNDLYRLLGPQLGNMGVTAETDIEYRHGAYFVLAVNITSINWMLLLDFSHYQIQARKRAKGEQPQTPETTTSSTTTNTSTSVDKRFSRRTFFPTQLDSMAQVFAWIYYTHWIIAIPMCTFWYFIFRQTVNTFLLSYVSEEVFRYVEQKGMEMAIMIKCPQGQAPFMLGVMREQRDGEQTIQKNMEEAAKGEQDTGTIIGPLLGPAAIRDGGDASPPPHFTIADNLEFESVDIVLPVGFSRLRWALLSKDSTFLKDAVWETEANYLDIQFGTWSQHSDYIGMLKLPDDINHDDFIGAQRESSYLMPKSAFVKANTAHETVTLTEYNHYCFVIKTRTRTPEVPFGQTFVALTQLVLTDTGKGSCRMVASVEAYFPNGQPMVARQIKSGMRTGVTESFTLLATTIIRYANVYP